MIELGSYFNSIDGYCSSKSQLKCLFGNDARFFADGRHALNFVFRNSDFKRIWIPCYFCPDVVASIRTAGMSVCFYNDMPGKENDDEIVRNIDYKDGDILLRMNFFGMRSYRDNCGIPVPVIEDHSHDLIGDWASRSNADFCVASIRKSIPVAEGGVAWSPKGLFVDCAESLPITEVNSHLAEERWKAMEIKSCYLDKYESTTSLTNQMISDKHKFRDVIVSTEMMFDNLSDSSIDFRSMEFLRTFDFQRWYEGKKKNYKYLCNKLSGISNDFRVLIPDNDKCEPFSLPILFATGDLRDKYLTKLVGDCVYPAVLWNVPEEFSNVASDMGNRLMSVHCDARHSFEDLERIVELIKK